MLAQLGQYSSALALAVSLLLAVLPLIGAQTGRVGLMQFASRAAYLKLLLILFAFVVLTISFIENDFSLLYVSQNSNSALPLQFRIAAVWGAHEGSLLLWALILAVWTAAVATFSKQLPLVMKARVLAIMGWVSAGFISFMLFTSNPFELVFPVPADGQDLNPLLQDFALIIHPPILYMGYVGFSVAYAFTVAALIGGRLDATWARWMRPWTTMAWLFLTIGISLGSWWAYYELGWGGWWFWDPVENASFMPWLAGTALIHSLAVTEKRAAFKTWTCMLAICAFALSLLGTFLVRSGVLVSVHAFTTDPERGVYILGLLLLLVGGAFMLYSWRAPKIKNYGQFTGASRELWLLINNILLFTAMVSVLVGTLYPIFGNLILDRSLSIGEPWFNLVFLPLGLLLLLAMALGTATRWKRDNLKDSVIRGKWSAIIALLAAALGIALAPSYKTVFTILALLLAVWVSVSAISEPLQRIRKLGFSRGIKGVSQSTWGMVFAHIGVAVFSLGVAFTEAGSSQHDTVMAPGGTAELGAYEFKFLGVKNHQGPNYEASRGYIEVFKQGKFVAELNPEKRFYTVRNAPMTEAGIDPTLWRDLYVSLGEPTDDQGRWSLRMQVKPLVRWIWLGTIIMALGGLLAATDKRYRRLGKTTQVSGAAS